MFDGQSTGLSDISLASDPMPLRQNDLARLPIRGRFLWAIAVLGQCHPQHYSDLWFLSFLIGIGTQNHIFCQYWSLWRVGKESALEDFAPRTTLYPYATHHITAHHPQKHAFADMLDSGNQDRYNHSFFDFYSNRVRKVMLFGRCTQGHSSDPSSCHISILCNLLNIFFF